MIHTVSVLATFSATALTLTALYAFSLVIYRLYLSPLAKIPGPKLAAATNWYQEYFDLVAKSHGCQFPGAIKRMHEQYGLIVRIAPDEIHIDDPEYWQEVYCNNSTARPIDKQERLTHRFGFQKPCSALRTPNCTAHDGISDGFLLSSAFAQNPEQSQSGCGAYFPTSVGRVRRLKSRT
jgi:hypothetical protein